jgi:hypothetical protein
MWAREIYSRRHLTDYTAKIHEKQQTAELTPCDINPTRLSELLGTLLAMCCHSSPFSPGVLPVSHLHPTTARRGHRRQKTPGLSDHDLQQREIYIHKRCKNCNDFKINGIEGSSEGTFLEEGVKMRDYTSLLTVHHPILERGPVIYDLPLSPVGRT